MEEGLAYSFHLGNDKNKTKKARQVARTNPSGKTSFNNNGIQTTKQLSKVFNHNYRMYEKNQNEIYVLKGTTNLIQDVQDLYFELFEESRLKYNNNQTRNDRKIENYFNHISNSEKSDLACEIIIELGDMEYWEDKKDFFKLRMNDVFKEQIDYLEKIVPNFKVASAVSHFDEHSPHLHIVGVPFKTGNKNGMEIQVGKSAIFTKDSLKVIQDKMRVNCINKFNEVYSIDLSLKKKKKGRNNDIPTSEMDNYTRLKKELDNNKKKLEKYNKQTEILDNKSESANKILMNLKPTKIIKNSFTISDEDKTRLERYIQEVNATSDNMKQLNEFSSTIDDVKTEIKEYKDEIKSLKSSNTKQTNTINKLKDKITDKNDIIKEQSIEIRNLERKNSNLEGVIDYWQDKFDKLKKFLSDKLFHWIKKDDKYKDVVDDLVEKNILSSDDLNDIYSKEKDDYER